MKLPFDRLSVPILLLSDAPEELTGLARIGRDLASLLSTMPQFRVGYMGLGGIGRRKFPWTQYNFPPITGQWGEAFITPIWHDFAGDQNGVIMSLWDASRMLWFGGGQYTPAHLQKFLGSGRNFEKWGYFPVDGVGPDGMRLGIGMRESIQAYDRVITASEWGQGVTLNHPDTTWLPHGIFFDKFTITFHLTGRAMLQWDRDDIYLGCVMTNQARKDWPIAFETAAILRADYGNRFKFWIHTDEMIRYWNIYALAADYGLGDCLVVTNELDDANLALRYSSCDCTILPSAGEGFGYPIAESLACGTSCIVTGYAGGAELVPEQWRVEPVAYRVDSIHNVQRAVLGAFNFAARAKEQITRKREDWEFVSKENRGLVEHLNWDRLKHVWQKWFLEGIGQ